MIDFFTFTDMFGTYEQICWGQLKWRKIAEWSSLKKQNYKQYPKVVFLLKLKLFDQKGRFMYCVRTWLKLFQFYFSVSSNTFLCYILLLTDCFCVPVFIIMNIYARSFFSGALMLQWVSWCLVLIMSCIFLVSESLWSHNVGDVLREELGCCSVALHEVPRGERSHLEAGLQSTFLQYEQDCRGCWLVSCWPSFHGVFCEVEVGTLHSSSPCRTCMQCIHGSTEKPGCWLLLFRKMPHI